VYEGSRLERLPGLLVGQTRGGELAQFVVDEWQQLGGGLRISGRGVVEELGDVGHAAQHTPTERESRPETNYPHATPVTGR